MYCIKCGEKIQDKSNFCTKCGHKLNNTNNNSTPQKQDSDLPLIIGIISIICSFFINILILPIAIFGIVIGIKRKQTVGIILNLIAIITSTIIFLLFVFILFQISKYTSAITHNIKQHSYKDNYKENTPNEENIVVKDIIGTWYFYNNNTLSKDTYYTFNEDNTYTYITDQDKYTGTYTITKYYDYSNSNNKYKSYKIVMKNISLVKSNGTIITENIDDFKYILYIENENMQVKDINTNSYFTLKKDISIKY